MIYATNATYPHKPPNFQNTLNRLYSTANTSPWAILFFFLHDKDFRLFCTWV